MIVKREWETLFEKMNPGRFDNNRIITDAHYESGLEHVKDGWSLLDVGCATANLYKYTGKKNIDYTGMDFTQELLDGARERHPDVNLKLGSIMDIPYPDASFDVVYCKSVLEHIHPDEVKIAIDEMIRVARHMLVLVFHRTPDKNITDTKIQYRKNYFENTFPWEGLLNIIKDSGRFKELKTRVHGRMNWTIYLKEDPI